MGNQAKPEQLVESMRRIVGRMWKDEKRDFLRSLGDLNHLFRDLHRVNDHFDLGFTVGEAAREMIDEGPFDDRGEMESSLPE